MLVVPDTNFLIYLAKYRLWHEIERLYVRYSFLILPQVLHELEILATKVRGKDKEAAFLAFEWLKKLKLKALHAEAGHADIVLFQFATKLKEARESFVIATMDRKLIARLKAVGIKVLTIRQKKYLVEE